MIKELNEATATPADRIIEELRACIRDLVAALKEARAQMAFMHDKFQVTASGNMVLTRTDRTLTTHAEIIEKAGK